eukprot:301666-Chlamydomonas_euryale.AAC.1
MDKTDIRELMAKLARHRAMFMNDLKPKVICLLGRHPWAVVRSDQLSKRVNPQYDVDTYVAPVAVMLTEEEMEQGMMDI